jgi:CBS domain-containing protein
MFAKFRSRLGRSAIRSVKNDILNSRVKASANLNVNLRVCSRLCFSTENKPSPELADLPTEELEKLVRKDLLVRPKLRISDILAIKDAKLFTISQDATITEAISHLVKQSVSCCLTVDDNGEVSGIFTARDVLKFIQNTHINSAIKNRGQQKKATADAMLSPRISDITVKKEKLVYCSPDDTVRHCREIMFQLRIRNLPVLVKNECLGIVSIP